jgi:hypothetical protein
MSKENSTLKYINLILFLILIINIILLTTKYSNIEKFEEQVRQPIKIDTRPCTLHLTNNSDLCDQLEEIYKMSDIQIQVILNQMKVDPNANKTNYDNLRYIKDNKASLPLNACKIELNNLKESKNIYGSSNILVYKNLTKVIDYNQNNLSGYCLSDISSYTGLSHINMLNKVQSNISSNMFYIPLTLSNTVSNIIDNNNKYLAIKMKDNLNAETLLNEEKYICKNNTITLENNLKYIKLDCMLHNDIFLKVHNINIVQYSSLTQQFTTLDTNQKIDLFSYMYNNKQIIYVPKTLQLPIYKFTYNYCDKIESFKIYDNIPISLAELSIPNKIIKYNLDLAPYSSSNIDDNIPNIINNKLQSIFNEIKQNNERLSAFSSNQQNIDIEYVYLTTIRCPSFTGTMQKQDYDMCVGNANTLLNNSQLIVEQKYYVQQELSKLQNNYLTLIETNKLIRETYFSVKELQEYVKYGVLINYSKYANLISNDNSIYIQI